MTEGPEHPLAKAERRLLAAALVHRDVSTGKPRELTREDIIRSLNDLRRNGVINEHGDVIDIPAAFRRPPTTTSPTRKPEDQQ